MPQTIAVHMGLTGARAWGAAWNIRAATRAAGVGPWHAVGVRGMVRRRGFLVLG